MKNKLFLNLILTLFFWTTSQASTQAKHPTMMTSKQFSQYVQGQKFTEIQLKFDYAQSADVWATVDDVKKAQGSLSAINGVLREKYGKPEEAFARVNFKVDQSLGQHLPSRFFFGTGGEALGFGLIQNPVIPELHATGVALGIVSTGFTSTIYGPMIDFKVGFTGGIGREKRIDAISTDLIDRIPIRDGVVKMYGADFEFGKKFLINQNYNFQAKASLNETLFEVTTPQSDLNGEDTSKVPATHRWKLIGAIEKQLFIPKTNTGSISLELIGGPQPLPVTFLPRVWDYVHNLYAWPELGSMVGAGLYFKNEITNNTFISSHAGFYGGYWGGDFSIRWKAITLSASTWGVETTSAYHILGERFWQASLGFLF